MVVVFFLLENDGISKAVFINLEIMNKTWFERFLAIGCIARPGKEKLLSNDDSVHGELCAGQKAISFINVICIVLIKPVKDPVSKRNY